MKIELNFLLLCIRGISIGAALRAASHEGTVESVSSMKYEPSSVWGYVEVRFELRDLIVSMLQFYF